MFLIYALLVIDFVALYVVYYLYATADPGFSYTHAEHDRDKIVLSVLGYTAMMIAIYYIWYLAAMCKNIKLINRTDCNTKIIFYSS